MKHFLPTTKKEIEDLGWEYADVILITGDAYVDHSSFGAAVIGRVLEREGWRVAILSQPNWRDDWRDFKKLGKPRLFFGITAGNMDSMVNHYTAFKRLRSDDSYTAGSSAGFRPDYATVVYSRIVKQLFPDTFVVLGGIEASMRRLSYYDYWSDQLKPSILTESGADILVYGMGEKAIVEIAKNVENKNIEALKNSKQIAYWQPLEPELCASDQDIVLHSYESELKDKRLYGENFVIFETESHKMETKRLIQPYDNGFIIINPPYPPATESEMDSYALFDRMMNAPHPKYAKRGVIPAFEMIKNSITIHRGCFGGCSFCAIAAHQGKFISSRSSGSILAEIANLAHRDYFKGHISDLGGPSANMYRMQGKEASHCQTCKRASCIYPNVCYNLDRNHAPLLELYKKARAMKRIKKITIGSGIRYDMLIIDNESCDKKLHLTEYLETVVEHHVSGRLKVAPEHTQKVVLCRMRKPSFDKFLHFFDKFSTISRKKKKSWQLIPYFISSHPGCTIEDMAELAIETQRQNLPTEQVQDFTPTPMTYSTAMYYLGYDPYDKKPLKSARSIRDKREQNLFFFWYKKENMAQIKQLLPKMGCGHLLKKLYFKKN